MRASVFGIVVLLLAASANAQVGSRAASLVPPPIRFTNANGAAGFTGVFTFSNTDHSGGVAWIDYNGDHWPDLLMTNGLTWDNWLFRNNGDGTFTDVSSVIAKPTTALEIAGVCFADIDNDGDSDVFMPVDSPIPTGFKLGGPNLLYVNQGDGTFVESASALGLVDPLGRRSIAGNFADIDRDGSVDLYIGRWSRGTFPIDSFDRLLQNDGTGAFVDISAAAGFDPYGRNVLTSMFFDADFDGWQDLYVANVGEEVNGYSQPDNCDLFWRNDQTGLAFLDVTGGCATIGNDASAAMGLALGDIDNDGDWDLYITDNSLDGDAPLGNVLYLGDGVGGFVDNSCDVSGVCVGVSSWPCAFTDLDNDGLLDLWVGTEKPSDPTYVFLNKGDGTFRSLSFAALNGQPARGGATADYDGDGDVDFALWNRNSNSDLIRNDTVNTNGWISLRLFGATSNRDAIGALVRVTANGVTQMRQVSGGDSAHSQRELALNFGLGSASAIDAVEITWPSGAVQALGALPMGQLHFIDEASGLIAEALPTADVTWSNSTLDLVIEVQSNFGGRTGFDCASFGPLSWNPATLAFEATFPGVSANPGTVDLVSERGGVFTMTVTTVP